MPTIQVSEGQTPVDIALQQYGNLSAVFAFADINGISITDLLTPGTVVLAGEPEEENITALFLEKWQKPVSSFEDDEILTAEGLDFWIVEDDFVIS